ncbi:DUF2642 domain-containing protein [Paenibacillus sp. Marseille-Q4541]|uniref:DUF2642 domain-containing protein n=1 Tax=Paenibacillus sp. Marseille-Q4541 TaxID=2831522 RepID=UPI002019E4A7|nr:DUF2642 domain-containing protein [Paenibacillus sp. Marseille-Q4541]
MNKSWLGKQVELILSGCRIPIQGEIIDIGNDIFVIYGESRFIYIPIHHLQQMRLTTNNNPIITLPPDPAIDHNNISYRKILMNSRGYFSEISVGDKSLHGYVTAIMNDYFVFFSPLHRSVYISVDHLKYIVPYPPNTTPFSLSHEHFPLQPASKPLSRTLDQQIKKLEGELVILNLGDKPYRAGFLKYLDGNLLELVEAEGNTLIMHTDHIKTIHVP